MKTDDIEKSNFNPQMLKSCIDASYECGYQQGRADELEKIYKMMLLSCDDLQCEECAYEQYSQDVCQQAFTIGMIEKYIEEQLKEQINE